MIAGLSFAGILNPSTTGEITDIVTEAVISKHPDTLVCGQTPDVNEFQMDVTYMSGFSESVTPQAVTIDEPGTGMKPVTARYLDASASCDIQVVPRKITDLHILGESSTPTSVSVSWKALEEANRYEVEVAKTATGEFTQVAVTQSTTYNFTGMTRGEIWRVRVRAISRDPHTVTHDDGTTEEIQLIGEGEYSDELSIAPKPADMGKVSVSSIERKKIKLKWSKVSGATGYSVYYRLKSDKNMTKAGDVDNKVKYTVKGLKAGYDYVFSVVPYALDNTNTGGASADVNSGTAPSLPVLTVRGGDQTIRVNWIAGRSAENFKLYISDQRTGTYTLVKTFKTPIDFRVHSIHDLKNNSVYYIKMTAERQVYGLTALCETQVKEVKTSAAEATSTKAKIYKTKKEFLESPACKDNEKFNKLQVYKKNINMPGLINTNAGGFNAKNMVPQGMTVAGNYLLLTAYDYKKVDDSVIYVLNKNTKKLKTVVLLPHKGHVGGIAYDGTNIWLAYGKTMQCFRFSIIKAAIKLKSPCTELYGFLSTVETPATVSYITYYKKRIWAGTYDEQSSQYVRAYKVVNKTATPSVTQTGQMLLPNRTQGVTFASDGTMIVSRSCQTNSTKRGFLSRLDVYTPTIKVNKNMEHGILLRSIKMPPMNEGILCCGTYTYLMFESPAFSDCKAPVDRVIAFKTKDLKKKDTATEAVKKGYKGVKTIESLLQL